MLLMFAGVVAGTARFAGVVVTGEAPHARVIYAWPALSAPKDTETLKSWANF